MRSRTADARAAALAVLAVAVAAVGCAAPAGTPRAAVTSDPPVAPAASPPAGRGWETPTQPPQLTRVAYRIENRVSDPATADFGETVRDVLTDPRGWVRAGFVFVEAADAPYRVVLAEGPQVDDLCQPLETWSTYSCQNGPVVALNADRWRSATPQWTGDVAAYRVMLVNHEVGHLLHLHHPTQHCPAPGLPAPIMAQQSTELGDCAANPWPLQWEIELAAQRLEPLAPPGEHDPSDHRPTPPPVDR